MNLKQADKILFEISKKILLVTYPNPINRKEEKEKFFSSNKYNPVFKYKPFNTSQLEKKLKTIHIEEQGELAGLIKGAKEHLTKQLNCIKNRGTEKYTNIKLYGVPSNRLIMEAYDILQSPNKDFKDNKFHPPKFLKKELEKTIQKYGFEGWEVRIDKNILKTTINNLNKIIKISAKDKFSENRIKRLKVHEIGTHALRAMNGYNQDYLLFASTNVSGYLPTEEGLAILNEEKAGLIQYPILKDYAGRVIAVAHGLETSFRKTFKELVGYFNKDKAFELTTRIKRGLGDTSRPGGFIKDHVYLEGKLLLGEFVKNGGDLTPLYAGKIGLQHIDLVKKRIIKPPKYLPIL